MGHSYHIFDALCLEKWKAAVQTILISRPSSRAGGFEVQTTAGAKCRSSSALLHTVQSWSLPRRHGLVDLAGLSACHPTRSVVVGRQDLADIHTTGREKDRRGTPTIAYAQHLPAFSTAKPSYPPDVLAPSVPVHRPVPRSVRPRSTSTGTPLVRELGREAALLQTLRHARRNIRRQLVPELLHALAIQRHDAQVGLHEVGPELEQRLCGLLDAGVLAGEARDEDCGFAVGVEFGVCRLCQYEEVWTGKVKGNLRSAP